MEYQGDATYSHGAGGDRSYTGLNAATSAHDPLMGGGGGGVGASSSSRYTSGPGETNYSYQSTEYEGTRPIGGQYTSNSTYSSSSSSSHDHNRQDSNNTPLIDTTNANFHAPPPHVPTHTSSSSSSASPSGDRMVNNPVAENVGEKAKKGQQQAVDIITKTKKIVQHQWEQTCAAAGQMQKKVNEMMPKQGSSLVYWKNPIVSGVFFGLSLALIVTFMFLSSLAAISFWMLALLIVVGLQKLFNYVMYTFAGKQHDDIFEGIVSADWNISEKQAQAMANNIRSSGTAVIKQARSLFLWENLSNSIIFGFVLFVLFYIGLSMNALTLALVGLIFSFTVPKIYQVYQAPIDRSAKKVLDQINQLLAKVTSKIPAGGAANKAKKTT